MKVCCTLVAAIALATPVSAADCGGWKVGIEQDEGGPTMTASICASNRPDDLLLITCGGENKIGLRFLPTKGNDFPPRGDLNYSGAFTIASGSLRAEIILRYEAMDGAMTASPRRDGPLVRILMSHGPLTIAGNAGALPAATFTLNGSSNAIGKVMRACYS